MKLGIVRLREDQFEGLEQQFLRELLPIERKWLALADVMLKAPPISKRVFTAVATTPDALSHPPNRIGRLSKAR